MKETSEVVICEKLARSLEGKDWLSLDKDSQVFVRNLQGLGYLELNKEGFVGKYILRETPENRMYFYEYQNTFLKFCNDVYDEKKRAAEKFPKANRLLGAVMEEVGEMAEALLRITESEGTPQRVYDEAVQVASTVYRLASLGEPDYGYKGMKCSYNGCTRPAIGGPCALCYE